MSHRIRRLAALTNGFGEGGKLAPAITLDPSGAEHGWCGGDTTQTLSLDIGQSVEGLEELRRDWEWLRVGRRKGRGGSDGSQRSVC